MRRNSAGAAICALATFAIGLSGCMAPAENGATESLAEAVTQGGAISDADARAAVDSACAGAWAKADKCRKCVDDVLDGFEKQGVLDAPREQALEKGFEAQCQAGCLGSDNCTSPSDAGRVAVQKACAGAWPKEDKCNQCVDAVLDGLHKGKQLTDKEAAALAKELKVECKAHCVSISCASAGAQCGALGDGCGGALDCGGCQAPQTCGGGGKANTCGRVAPVDAGAAHDAGVVDQGGPATCATDADCRGVGACCAGTCVNIASDPNNCGACGARCIGQPCTNGTCAVVTGTNCGGVLNCVNGCGSSGCDQSCVSGGTATAQGLFAQLYQCAGANGCPTSGGGVCDRTAASYNQATCMACVAQVEKGPCISQYQACLSDVSGGGGGCVRTTCAAKLAGCGSIPDGCGGFIDCGSCTAPQSCGGGGVPNQCGGGAGGVCRTDADCNPMAPSCVAGQCVLLVPVGGPCATGMQCASGNCTNGVCSQASCPAGYTLCAGLCTNTMLDNNNCGACAIACPGGLICQLGNCATACPVSTSLCNGVCASLAQDPNNCGACGNVCASGVCQNSACVQGGACGSAGQPCCAGGSCAAGNACSACFNVCLPPQPAGGKCCLSTDCQGLNCLNGVCQGGGGCTPGSICPNGTVCSPQGACGAGCPSGTVLCGTVCASTANDPTNCGTCGNVCPSGACNSGVCTSGCQPSSCASQGAQCGTIDDGCGNVLGCGSCPPGASCVNHLCAGAPCGSAGQPCCVGTANGACGVGLACANGVCQSASCGAGYIDCNGSCVNPLSDSSNCGGCNTVCAAGTQCSNAQCVGSCNANNCPNGCCRGNNCVAGNSSSSCGTAGLACMVCPFGQSCVNATCVPGCLMDGIKDGLETGVDCGGGVCPACSIGQGCNVNSDCSPPTCVANVCSFVQTCGSGLNSCNGTCVNLGSDPANCGSCGHVCQSGTCQSAVCVPLCGSGLSLCNNTCVDTTSDRLNCGGCGKVCPPGVICQAGVCQNGNVCGNQSCAPASSCCNNACVSTSNDPNNCGGCGVGCPSGVCQAGLCVQGCGGGLSMCNNACVNLATDPLNCGACGTVCAIGNACVNGQCVQQQACQGGLSPLPVVLGTAVNYVILAKTAVSTVPRSAVTGDIGLSPAPSPFITGFALTGMGAYWTSAQVTGNIYSADNDLPTPINLITAVTDMQTAYTDAAGRPMPDCLNLGAGTIGGLVLAPGLYKWTSSVTIPSDVTISGGSNDVWIFQIAGDLTMSPATKVTLLGGAKAKNIFWQVGGHADLGTAAHFEGTLLCQTAISLMTGASVNGRLLAQTAISFASSVIALPAP